MAINIKFDTAGNPEPPSIILATKNGNKLGLLNVNADSIELNDKLKISEISFTLNKYVDGEINNLWDKVVDFKLVWCKEWDCWFEIKVELDEATETVKTVFGTQLGQAELSQIMIYNMEVNTEEDIARDDYKITILYDENDHEASLLHRIFKDKAPHYSIAYVDPTIARIQRQFSWDGSSICDVLDEIEKEIGCLVVYNSNSIEGGMPNRSISVYDLEQNCNDCGHRGEFTDECPKCGSKNIKYGYGEDTTIFVTNDELATEGIQLVADIDSVKNCFKLEAGDDLMTATIRNCNPNGSDYIWRFSNDIKEDMSNELVEKLKSYDAEYKRYYNKHESNLNATLLTQYNSLVEKYDDFYNTDSTCLNCDNKGKFYDKCPSCNSENLLIGKELQKISTPIVGYSSLMNAYYNTIDFALYLESGLMPSITMSDTTAEEQASLLTSSSLSPVAVNVKEISSISPTTADSAVLSMAKVIVKSTYKVEILSSSLSTEKKWSGTFKITNYSDDTDTAEVVVNDIVVNNNAETFIKQKIEKALNKEDTDDYSISGLFEKEYDKFCTELKKYALKPLQSFYDAADACISILTEQGAGDEINKPDLYENLYLPYFQKQEAVASEISVRKNELAIIEGVYDETTKTTSGGLQNNIRNCQSVIQEALNFEDYLGENLWKEFCSFRREDKYSNSNYISDGLNNAQLFERALEFFDVAENEIYKSSELQHSISTSLNNLLAIDKFKPLVKYFKNGNWIRVRVDDKIYKLRLLEYDINFGNFENIPVEFSDVTKIKNSITDVQNVLEQASSVASSYDAVTRQAKKGNVAKGTIEQWIDEGLNAANVQIQSNDSEEIIITKNGLLGRSYDDITGTYSPEQLKITHNIMAYTDDNWETVKQAIGKHTYSAYDEGLGKIVDNKIGYGMSAEFVTAGVVSGSQIIGGDVYSDNYSITDRTGSYLNLRDGTFSFGGGALRFEGGELLISSPNVLTKNEVTTINEEYLKTTSVYAENLRVNAAYIQEQLTASQINTKGLIAENISSTTIDGKTITGGSILIGDTTKVNDYAEIANDGTLTCTNVDIKGGMLTIGSKDNEETHTWIASDGTLNTYNANISGEIRASKGSIGGFTIETTETNEDGSKSGGWLYSGESIGSDKSIFLSATDMSGTVSNTQAENWRLTVGEHFGVVSNGTAYMSNCEITGGSLRMGTANSGYHTWISEDGVLNAQGANIDGTINAVNGNIGGWKITTDALYKNISGISSGMCSVQINTASEGLEYALSSDETFYIVIGIGSCVSTNVVIPSTYNGMLVKSIDNHAFSNCSSLKSVTIPNSVTSIGSYAFSSCNSLKSVTIPDSVTSIDNYTFYNCSSLVRVVISDNVTSIGNSAFLMCTSLTNVIIGNGVTSIGNGAFGGCTSLTSVYYVGSENDWNEIAIGSTNSHLESATRYYYSSSEMINNCSSLVSENNISPPRFFAGSVNKIPTVVDDAKFLVLEDGSFYATAAKITGTIHADEGSIGSMKITEEGLSGTNLNGDSWYIKQDGIDMPGTSCSIKMGGFKLNNEKADESKDISNGYIQTQGQLVIASSYDNNAEASITFQGQTKSTEEDSARTITLTLQRYYINGTESTSYYAKVTAKMDKANDLGRDYEFTLYRRVYRDQLFGLSEDSTKHKTFVIKKGESEATESWEYTFTQTALILSVPKIAFGFKESDVKSLEPNDGAFYGMEESNPFDNPLTNIILSPWKESRYTTNNTISIKGNLLPTELTDKVSSYSLGSEDAWWKSIWGDVIYQKGSSVSSSDTNKKNTINDISNAYSTIFDDLRPVTFKYNDGTSDRLHTGFLAPEVKDAILKAGLTTKDFAAYCEWKEDDTTTCGLRYSEFIALCVDQIQKLKKRVAELEIKLNELNK